jgi:2-polyprenyl-6-methoxyphenol hydroxylase-like FAD-dependent oxidoreductase
MMVVPLVVVVGAGLLGLLSSILLSLYNIPHILFERHGGTSVHSKAISVHQCTVEILRRIGVEKKVLEQRAPAKLWTGRQKLYSRSVAGGEYTEEYEKASPVHMLSSRNPSRTNSTRTGAGANPEGIKFNSEVIDCVDGGDKVTLTIRHKDNLLSRITCWKSDKSKQALLLEPTAANSSLRSWGSPGTAIETSRI